MEDPPGATIIESVEHDIKIEDNAQTYFAHGESEMNPSRTRKRTNPYPSPSEQSSKKAKPSPGHSPSQAATETNKETWQGFCEIESEPAYFSVLLREMGVQGVTVREVFTMDPSYLQDTLPQPIHGLILVFHYREFGNADQPAECPADVWFANQLPAQNSCATLAMLNILMNSTEVDVGEHLNQFKEFTSDFTPYQKGEALASYDFVKRIHNSFAKKMDLLESDKYLSHKVARAARKLKDKAERLSKKGTKSRRRGASVESAASDNSAEDNEAAHHFIAFVPVGNEVWKLDGLDAQPTSMGTFDASGGETWLSAVADTIGALMAAGDDDYGVVALTQSPLVSLRREAYINLNMTRHIEARLDTLNADWKSFTPTSDDNKNNEPPSPHLLGISDQLDQHSVPASLATTIDTELMPDLLDRRSALAKQLTQLTASIMTEIQAEAEEDQKAAQRRYDCGPVIKRWLEMLAETGYLEANLERFLPAVAGRGGAKTEQEGKGQGTKAKAKAKGKGKAKAKAKGKVKV